MQGVLIQGPDKFHMSSSKFISGQAKPGISGQKMYNSHPVPVLASAGNSKNKGWALQLSNSLTYFAELPHAEIANDV